jgi:hypothetical protein
VDRFLAQMSWDKTVEGMLVQIESCASRNIVHPPLPMNVEPQERP